MIRKLQISIKNLESKKEGVEKTPNNPKQSIFEPEKGFTSDEIKNSLRKTNGFRISKEF